LSNWSTTHLTVSIAVAKQMPCAPGMIAVLTPITSPRGSASGPPELPGFSAASVCSTSSISRSALRAQTAPERAHHARGDGVLEAVGIADRNCKLPDAHLARRAEHHRVQGIAADADHRDCRYRILADQIRFAAQAIANVAGCFSHHAPRGCW